MCLPVMDKRSLKCPHCVRHKEIEEISNRTYFDKLLTYWEVSDECQHLAPANYLIGFLLLGCFRCLSYDYTKMCEVHVQQCFNLRGVWILPGSFHAPQENVLGWMCEPTSCRWFCFRDVVLMTSFTYPAGLFEKRETLHLELVNCIYHCGSSLVEVEGKRLQCLLLL